MLQEMLSEVVLWPSSFTLGGSRQDSGWGCEELPRDGGEFHP